MTEAEIEAAIVAAPKSLTRDQVIDILQAAEDARLIEFTCVCGNRFEVKSEQHIVGTQR